MSHQEAFLALVRAGLWEDINDNDLPALQACDLSGANLNDNLFEALDWGRVILLAEEQSMVGHVTAGLEKLPTGIVPLTEKLTLLGECQLVEQRNVAMNSFIADLMLRLREAGINAVLVKGQGVAQCYDRPLWRESGDVDLLLNENDYEKAKALLLPLANSVEPEGVENKHLGMYIDSWMLELHGSLRCGIPSRINKVLDEIQRDIFGDGNLRSWMNGNSQIFMPSADNDAVYIFTHFLNHFYKGGVGLRQICDWCRLLWKYRNEIDLAKLEQRIQQMRLVSEWKAFGAFAVERLGMPDEAMPLYDPDEKLKRKAYRIERFILMSGDLGKNRDMSYYGKYPYLIRKTISMKRRFCDLINHASIFPVGSMRFLPSVMFNGFKAASKGE